jgi:hypothetical protein
MDLVTNGVVVITDAIRFVEQKIKEKLNLNKTKTMKNQKNQATITMKTRRIRRRRTIIEGNMR